MDYLNSNIFPLTQYFSVEENKGIVDSSPFFYLFKISVACGSQNLGIEIRKPLLDFFLETVETRNPH